jgi:hypothetical protein
MTNTEAISPPSDGLPLGLTEEVKRRLAALEVARAASYKSFNDRRDYEWKMCIAIWTFLSVFASALVIGKDPLAVSGLPLTLGAIAVATFASLLHIFWTFGISRANAIDIGVAMHYATEIQKVLAVPYSCELTRRLTDAKNRLATSFRWSHFAEVLLTASLGIAIVLASWNRDATGSIAARSHAPASASSPASATCASSGLAPTINVHPTITVSVGAGNGASRPVAPKPPAQPASRSCQEDLTLR